MTRARSMGTVTAGLLAVLVAGLLPVALQATQAVAAETTTSRTLPGSGRFSDLEVTVSQVTNMRNQVVRVSWTGAQPTSTSGNGFVSGYLQIMQCWGDESAPVREKCQFGGIFDDSRGGEATSRRELVGGAYEDKKETYSAPFPARAVVPFTSVSGKTVTTRRNEFFDTLSTNEIPYARTSNDGTGEEFFEVQTTREAPGLGCGARLSGGEVRDCWLVVVPRDDIEVTGQPASELGTPRLQTSPLAATNFENAISFRLDFEPVGVACPIGSAERRLLGNEDVAEAIVRWQPTLCEETGSIFGFSQIGDDLARKQVLTDTPWMSLVGGPLDPDLVTDDRPLAYAPVAISGVGIALVVERYPRDSASDETKAKKGTRVLDLKLNARLVAKLLTQSYVGAVAGPIDHVQGNPTNLLGDPEFLELNPEFNHLQAFSKLHTITTPIGLADANKVLWEWIGSDPDAKAFIDGKADRWGMKVNPYYKDLDLDRSDFPRADPTCTTYDSGQAPLCALEMLAYSADFHASARGAIRGVTQATDNWDWSSDPPRYKPSVPQQPGERGILVVADTATAARYQVPMARLENAAGEFVAPTEASLLAGVAAMSDERVSGVLEPDPAAKKRGAYPLTEVTYAVTAPRQLTKAEAEDYAALVRYAAGPGQTPGVEPGQLPAGYLPLTPELRKSARKAADLIASRAPAEEEPPPAPRGPETLAPSAPTEPLPSPTEELPPVTAPVDTPGTTTTATPELAAAATPTPMVSAGATRFALLLALLAGLLAVLVRPALLLASRLTHRGEPSPTTSTR